VFANRLESPSRANRGPRHPLTRPLQQTPVAPRATNRAVRPGSLGSVAFKNGESVSHGSGIPITKA
jgi:hypothetical protein